MALQGVNKIAAGGVPHLAGPIVTAGDELVAILIEAAVGERQHVTFQFLY